MFSIFRKSVRDELSAVALSRALGKDAKGMFLSVADVTDSTNADARRYVSELSPEAPERAVFAAGEQTGGRGRLGRSFYSPAGTGVYFSVVLRPRTDFSESAIPCAASVAVLRAIRKLSGVTCGIKWVNDLLLDGKKVCGILCERVNAPDGSPRVIVGIGVNLTTVEFPAPLGRIAGSVGKAIPRATLIAEIVRGLDDPSDGLWLEDYRAHSAVLGRRVAWHRVADDGGAEPDRVGVAVSIDGVGGLAVRSDDGETVVLRSGEITLRLADG